MTGTDDAMLTEKGIKQAMSAGKSAKAEGLNFDVIISSPLPRALDTAKLVARELGYSKDIEQLAVLRERWFGELEGKFLAEEIGHPLEYYFANPLCIDDYPGVEKLADLHKRAEDVIAMAKNRPEDAVLLVSHGALARSILKVLSGARYDKPIDALENAKIIKLI
jgi:probable phosphoglycerate mutase